MKKHSNQQYAIALYEATRDLRGEHLKQAIANFVMLLKKQRKLKQASGIISAFEKYAKKQEGITQIEIVSARALGSSMARKIMHIFGEKVEAGEKIDQSLLGGVLVKTEDRILDASLRKQLERLERSLI